LTAKGSVNLERSSIVGGPLDLEEADIGGGLLLSFAQFDGGVTANDLKLRGYLQMYKTTVGATFALNRAVIEGNISFVESTFVSVSQMESTHVKGSVFIRNSSFMRELDASAAQIANHLDIAGSTFEGLVFHRGSVGGDFRLSWPGGASVIWWPGVRLSLRDSHAGVVQASVRGEGIDPWPQQLDLQGFTYDRFGASDDIARFERWLARDPSFGRQPYQQLATVLRSMGESDKSDDVLLLARDRELSSRWAQGCGYGAGLLLLSENCWTAAGLFALKITIGYGLGKGLFLALLWVLFFALLGMLVLLFSRAGRAEGRWWCFGASLNRLLPIIELNEEFKDFFNDPQRVRLTRKQQAYFACHAIAGYVLASFVIAALAGLTQATK
jgi:hypothetical protein